MRAPFTIARFFFKIKNVPDVLLVELRSDEFTGTDIIGDNMVGSMYLTYIYGHATQSADQFDASHAARQRANPRIVTYISPLCQELFRIIVSDGMGSPFQW